jgi:S-adenosylmethionine decarboxylase
MKFINITANHYHLKNNMTYTSNTNYPAGKHLLIDFWGAYGLTDATFIELTMREAAKACGASVLNLTLHQFGDGGGITGVALLAESHISIHTWPEIHYAALDVFVCGTCDAERAVALLKDYFKPTQLKITSISRGVMSD